MQTMTFQRAAVIWASLALAALLIFLASLAFGSLDLPPTQWLSALWHGRDDPALQIVVRLRAPRAAAGFACGALLAVAGALLQILLRNPLADPYIFGISGGAACFALIVMLLTQHPLIVQGGALTGALTAMMLVLIAGRRELLRGNAVETTTRLLLTGVMLATVWGALVTLLLTIAPERALRGMLFWLTGDLSGIDRATAVLPAFVALIITLALSMSVAPQLNALLRGEMTAHTLGVAVAPLRLRLYCTASLATAVAVTTAGTVGFIGLVVPHLIRLAFGNDQRMLLPAVALAGGAFVMSADLAARLLAAPVQLPLGAMTALIGAPVFLMILFRTRY